MPRLDRPEVGAQTAIVNVSAGTLDLRGAKASIWVNAARVGEINPLTSGASAGPMTFQDVDGHGFLTSGDRFVVETIAGNEYRIDLYFGSCPFPSSQGWTS